MKIVQCKQGDDVWRQSRSGLPTASCFDQIITPRTRKASASQDTYLARLLCEWFLGRPLEDDGSAFMERGKEMEPEAVARYEWDTDQTATEVGLCLLDDGSAGASPDRLVGDEGLLEVKCPALTTHMGYVLDPSELVAAYWAQVQGELWVTGRKWADLISYNPVLPLVRVRVEPAPEFVAALDIEVPKFVVRLDNGRDFLRPERAKYQEACRERAARLAAVS